MTLSQSAHSATPEAEILNYYDRCEKDYEILWGLKENWAMHYGFWASDTLTLSAALQRQDFEMARMIGISKEDHILDAGCGFGGSAMRLAEKFGCQVTGITLSQKQATQATETASQGGLSQKLNFVRADYHSTPFADASFDVVWAIESTCYSLDKQRFVEEAFRNLKPGGRLIVADGFMSPSATSRAAAWIGKKAFEGMAVPFLEEQNRFTAFLEQAGFGDVQFRNCLQEIMPSSKKLFKASFRAFFLNMMSADRGKTEMGNCKAAFMQHIVLKKGICNYGVFTALKPA